MEDSRLEQRIKLIQHIQEAWRDSGERRSLVEILTDHTFGMTRDELVEFLNGSIAPKLEQAWRDLDASKAREEASAQDLEREREARRKAEKASADKDAVIAAKDAEIERLRKEGSDAKDTKATDRRDRFGSKSRKRNLAVDRNFNREKKDRPEQKEDFDGTDGQQGAEDLRTVNVLEEGAKFLTQRELDAREARKGTHYTMADASCTVIYECDADNLPEGWERCDDRIYTETYFDTKTTVTARKVKFVKARRLVKRVLEDGTEEECWEEDKIHVPFKGARLKKDVGLPLMEAETGEEPFTISNIPGRLPGTSSTPAMATKILMDVHICIMPVNRISNVFAEYGFRKGRQGIINWILKYADMLRPAYKILQDTVLCEDASIFCDETWQRLHLNSGTRKVYEWILGNKKKKATFYYYDDGSRGRKVIAELLEGRKIKAVHTDGYNACLFLEGVGVIHITCTAHVWRYIMDWYNATQDPDAGRLLTGISGLYIIESEIRGRSPEEIVARRQSFEVTEILTRYKALLDTLEQKFGSLPKIAQKAVSYAQSQYPKMSRWREDADFEIDNNFAERAARPAALERKNRLFYCSHAGARAACVIRSFTETCKQCGASIYEFFVTFFNGVAMGRTDYENMMPWCLVPNR